MKDKKEDENLSRVLNPNIDKDDNDGNYIENHIVTTREARSDAVAKFKNGRWDRPTEKWLSLYVADYKIKGYSAGEIRKFMNRDFGRAMPVDKIQKIINKLYRKWKADNMKAISHKKSFMEVKLDRLESSYWQGWERSGGKLEDVTVKTEEERSPESEEVLSKKVTVTKKRRNSPGDGKFLDGIAKCLKLRSELYGLNGGSIDVDINIEDDQKTLDVEALDLETILNIKKAYSAALGSSVTNKKLEK